MNPSRTKHVSQYYILAFTLAVFLRFVALGSYPLGDSEAAWALQALGLAQGERPLLVELTVPRDRDFRVEVELEYLVPPTPYTVSGENIDVRSRLNYRRILEVKT